MISVEEARARILALMSPVGVEPVPLDQAAGRVLAAPVRAMRDQPPFAASAMDGWALRAAEATPGAQLRIFGEAHAGRGFSGALPTGGATRIFTGAPLPRGADAVLIQEEAARDGAMLKVRGEVTRGAHIRAQGADFRAGDSLEPPRRLSPADIALIAAMGCAAPLVRRRPRICVIPTGDELIEPGGAPGPDQIFASNHFGVAAIAQAAGAHPTLHPIVADDPQALSDALRAAAENSDLLVTLGGASVGERDFLRAALGAQAVSFHKIAMRPGKPLTLGTTHGAPLLGLPGNPVSAMICAELFLRPAIAALLGFGAAAPLLAPAMLDAPLPANGQREHYLRATSRREGSAMRVRPVDSQDSALLTRLARADALIRRPVGADAAPAGALVDAIILGAPLDEQI